ncbi:MAG: hypothetical protein JWN89_579 [Parcubacteria group bacterium]|nr:hypothetical protein [Parcubacteria group bacterium]
MESRFKNSFAKRSIVFLLLISIVSSTVYLPIFARKADALFGVGDFGITIDVKALLREIADGAAMILAQKMIDDIVKSTVTWANNGFNGNPAYITDPKRFITNIADQTAGSFIQGTDLGFMCSPFRDTIRLSLALEYYQPPETQFQCSLTGIKGNIDAFYNDFSAGGWDAWFSMTQTPTNNPYGAYLAAKTELDSRIASAVGQAESESAANQGFLNLKDCAATNPSQDVIDAYETGDFQKYTSPAIQQAARDIGNGKIPYDPTKPAGACIKDGPIKTAGTTIKAQLDNVLPSGLQKLVTLNHVEQLVGAFASGLLKRYVFGNKGTFSAGYSDYLSTSNAPAMTNPETGGTPAPTSGATTTSPFLSCVGGPSQVTMSGGISESVTWSFAGNFGQAIDNSSVHWTFDPDASVISVSDTTSTVVYSAPGSKRATVTVASGGLDFVYANCLNNVTVQGNTSSSTPQ